MTARDTTCSHPECERDGKYRQISSDHYGDWLEWRVCAKHFHWKPPAYWGNPATPTTTSETPK